MAAKAADFLDRIEARRLRRYKKGGKELPSYQLFAIEDHDQWDAMAPKAAALAYQKHHKPTPADGGDPDDFLS